MRYMTRDEVDSRLNVTLALGQEFAPECVLRFFGPRDFDRKIVVVEWSESRCSKD